jgi:hypothetical protein
MNRRAVAFLAILCGVGCLPPTQASAFDWYRAHRHHASGATNVCYFRGPRWDYSAAYSPSGHGRKVVACDSHPAMADRHQRREGSPRHVGGPTRYAPSR